MANTKSSWVDGSTPMPTPDGTEVTNVMLSANVASTTLNDLIILGELPEDCVLVDAVYLSDDIDSGGTPAVAFSFGTVNSAETDLATVIESGITVGRTGTAARMTPTPAALAVKGNVLVGYKVTTAAATSAAGNVKLSLSYRAEAHGA